MSNAPVPDGQRIAIVGAGISGLVAAYLLQQRHEITVYEAGAYIGGHTNTIEVDTPQGPLPVDTGFIVYNERNYPLFSRLIEQLGVESQPSTMSFSVSDERSGLEYNGSSLNQLFASRKNIASPKHWRMIRDIMRFNRDAEQLHERGTASTVEEYVRENGFSDAFLTMYLIPIGASIWSCPSGTFRSFPIRFVIDFLRNHGMLQVGDRPQWRVIRSGSKQYIKPLTASFHESISINTPVQAIERTEDAVSVRLGSGEQHAFDHVVLACHSDQALRLLERPTPTEQQILSAFPYQLNETVLHTDASILPRRRRAWGSWNYRIREDNADRVAITYYMNMLQSLESREHYCVTLNETDRIDPAKIIRTIPYHHPIFTQERDAAQARHYELIGPNRTSFCGAYWGYGFHEDGAQSGARVAAHFGCTL
ncbi:MAG: NAD(P)/FAD-dependent oxidoreductase [Phycisphaerales bacterium]